MISNASCYAPSLPPLGMYLNSTKLADPALKGRRTKTAPSFVLVEDEETVTETTQLANVSQEENLVDTIAESVREEVINASTASVVLEDSPLIS